MFLTLTLSCALAAAAPKVESKFEQVAPPLPAGRVARSPMQTRAVLLIHGYRPHLIETSVARPDFRDWQKPGALLVRELARDSDVFAFSYGQDGDLDAI